MPDAVYYRASTGKY